MMIGNLISGKTWMRKAEAMVSWKDALLRARHWIINAKEFVERRANVLPVEYDREWWKGYIKAMDDAVKLIDESGKLKEQGK
jgi:hypothetical protein